MNPWLVLGIVGFFGGLLGNRRLAARALAPLDDAQKGRYLDAFARVRWPQVVVPGVLLLGFLAGRAWLPGRQAAVMALFWVGLFAHIVASAGSAWRRLGAAGLPRETRSCWALGQLCRWAGFAALLAGMLLGLRGA